MEGSQPQVSIVIPVHNEAEILAASVGELIAALERMGIDFELLLAENGSRDDTLERARELAAGDPRIRPFHHPSPDYGAALKEGIRRARGRFVICEEIDLCDSDFHRQALALLEEGTELVVGSKLAPGARDQRPALRHLASLVINGMLRLGLGFTGTDTHGLKAFRRQALLPVVESCVVGRDLFASELVVRAERAGISRREIPVTIEERRPPSIHLLRRVPHVLQGMARLVWVIRFQGARQGGEGSPPGA